MQKILVVGDCHFPFSNHETLLKIITFAKNEQPDVIVQIGDLYDLFAMSKFPRSMNVSTPAQEIEDARNWAEWFWAEIRKDTKATCYQIKGNHDQRASKRIIEKLPEIACLMRGLDELFNFPGVSTIKNDRDELEIDDIIFIHGYKSRLGDHMRFMNRNVVCGHSHRGGVVFQNSYQNKILWELNAGFCADVSTVPLQYTPQKFTHWTQGFGYIDSNGPRFCPLG